MLAAIREHAADLPTLLKFVIGLIVILGVPPICRRIRLPPVVGLLAFGVAFGPHGLQVVGEHRPVADFFAELGKLFLMFFAGLEIDLALFRRVQRRSIIFGIFTTSIPLIFGSLVALKFGYAAVPAVVVGSLLASHTLLASPIVSELGATKLEPVTVTYGATMLSDTLSLVVFAVCVQTFVAGFSVPRLLLQIVEICAFIPALILLLSRGGGWALRKVEKQKDAYFILMLLIVAAAALLSRLIQLPDIVGAFLAGLSLNAAVSDKPVKEELEFFGKSFFIPIFFISIGFLIDPTQFVHSIVTQFPLAVSLILALLIGKWIAAESTGRAFRYSPIARKTVWSLTLPQVAATLAATLVAYKTLNAQGKTLLDQQMMNVVLVMVVVTSILGPVLTARFAPKMVAESSELGDQPLRRAG